MSMTRRSLFGLFGGVLASLGLDGPAQAADGLARAVEGAVRRTGGFVIYGNGADGDLNLDPNKTQSGTIAGQYDAFILVESRGDPPRTAHCFKSDLMGG